MHKRPPVSLLVLVAALAVRAVADAPQPLRLQGRRVGRALAQAAPSGQTLKYAPCNAAAELTRSGVPSTKAICYNKVRAAKGRASSTYHQPAAGVSHAWLAAGPSQCQRPGKARPTLVRPA